MASLLQEEIGHDTSLYVKLDKSCTPSNRRTRSISGVTGVLPTLGTPLRYTRK